MYRLCYISVSGSMPPNSEYLWQEGMCVKSFKLVEQGIFQEAGLGKRVMCCLSDAEGRGGRDGGVEMQRAGEGGMGE